MGSLLAAKFTWLGAVGVALIAWTYLVEALCAFQRGGMPAPVDMDRVSGEHLFGYVAMGASLLLMTSLGLWIGRAFVAGAYRGCMQMLLVLAALALQDPQAPAPLESPRNELPEYHPEEALVCLDRKVVGPKERGLYLRHKDGELERVWVGEPYDALWRLDRTVFVTERWTGKVIHLAADFSVLRTWEGFVNPVDVEVTKEGLIVVVENGANRVTAFDPETGDRRWSRTGFQDPFDAAVLADGGLLVADSGAGRVVRLDAAGKIVRVHSGLGFPNAVEALAEGGFLVANWSGGEVRSYGSDGELIWRARPGGTLFSIERRADGRTLVGDGGGRRVIVYDDHGRQERIEKLPKGCVDYETILRL